MPPSPHRTVDASVFLAVYLEESTAEDCEAFLNLDVSTDTIISDLTIGEVLLRLKKEAGSRATNRDSIPDFLQRIDTYELVPLSPTCLDLARQEGIRRLRGVQDKDRLLVAYAIENRLTNLATIDRGLQAEQASISALCEELGQARLRIEEPRSTRGTR